jgi:hypothetical protein
MWPKQADAKEPHPSTWQHARSVTQSRKYCFEIHVILARLAAEVPQK